VRAVAELSSNCDGEDRIKADSVSIVVAAIPLEKTALASSASPSVSPAEEDDELLLCRPLLVGAGEGDGD